MLAVGLTAREEHQVHQQMHVDAGDGEATFHPTPQPLEAPAQNTRGAELHGGTRWQRDKAMDTSPDSRACISLHTFQKLHLKLLNCGCRVHPRQRMAQLR